MAEVKPGSGLEEPRPAFGVALDADLSGRAFAAKAGGTHRYLSVEPTQKERLLGLYAALVSAAPAPRPVRRKPPGADVPPPVAAVPPAATAGGKT
jgi:hypothetical protein